jgi:hypothetical protein
MVKRKYTGDEALWRRREQNRINQEAYRKRYVRKTNLATVVQMATDYHTGGERHRNRTNRKRLQQSHSRPLLHETKRPRGPDKQLGL